MRDCSRSCLRMAARAWVRKEYDLCFCDDLSVESLTIGKVIFISHYDYGL